MGFEFECTPMTLQDRENFADIVKTIVVSALVRDGLLDYDAANRWSKNHTVIGRKKSIFRTISRLWKNIKESGGTHWFVVSKYPEPEDDDEPGDNQSA